MTKYLCETCARRHGDMRYYHYRDSLGIERSITNVAKVRCSATAERPWIERDPVEKGCDCAAYKKMGKR